MFVEVNIEVIVVEVVVATLLLLRQPRLGKRIASGYHLLGVRVETANNTRISNLYELLGAISCLAVFLL